VGGGYGGTNCIYFILIVYLQEPLEVVRPENRDFIEINRYVKCIRLRHIKL
jgi:hypothetical protein